MLKLIQSLIALNTAMIRKIRSISTYDKGLALYQAKEYVAAFPLIQEAAELGNPQAMSILGSAYLFGQGCAENGREAERWLRQAVEAGYDEAKSVLGMAYATGKAGCRQDIELALPLLECAAQAGDSQSQRMLDMIERREGMFEILGRNGRRPSKRQTR